MILPIPKTLAKLFDEHFGPVAFKTMLAQRLQSIQQGLVSGQTAQTDFGFDPNSIQAGALAYGTVNATTSGTAETSTTVTANAARQPRIYFIVSGNGYITNMTYDAGVATFTVASAATSQALVIGYLY